MAARHSTPLVRLAAMIASMAILIPAFVATDQKNSAAQPLSANVASDPIALPASIILTTDRTEISAGQVATLMATTDVTVTGTGTGTTITIVDQTTSTTLKTCTTGASCSVTSGFTTGGPHTYIANVNGIVSSSVEVARQAWTITLTTDTSYFAAGSKSTLTATANQNVGNTSSKYRIRIYDTTTGYAVTNCSTGTTCSVATSFNTGAPHTYVATVAASTGQTQPNYSSQTDIQATSSPVELSRQPWTVTLAVTQTPFAAGGSAMLTATANQNVGSTGGSYRIRIYDLTAGVSVANCSSGTTCSAASSFTAGGAHTYVATVAANTGLSAPAYGAQTDVQATSNQVTADRQSWSISLISDRSVFSAGESVTLTATANQDVGGTGGKYRIRIYDTTTGYTIKDCTSGTTCSVPARFYSGGPHTYVADVSASTGGTQPLFGAQTDVQATSNQVSASRSPWSVTLTANKTTFSAGEKVTFTAIANQDVTMSGSAFALRIYDATEGTTVKYCSDGSSCSVDAAFYSGGPHTYVADVASRSTGKYTEYGDQLDVQATSNYVVTAREQWTISLQVARSITSSAKTVVLTATANQDTYWSNGQFQIRLWDNTTGQYIETCLRSISCTESRSYPLDEPAHTYRAVVINSGEEEIEATSDGFSFDTGSGAVLSASSRGGGNPAQNNCQCSHADPVNSATGEFYLPVTDLSIPGVGPSLSIGRTYSAHAAAEDGPFGFGWSSGFDSRLAVLMPGDTGHPLPRQVEIIQENGSTVLFHATPEGGFAADARVLATLSFNELTQFWTYTRQGREIFTYDSGGLLVGTSDMFGNSIAVGRNSSSQVTSLTASGGRVITLSWTGARVTGVFDSAGRSVQYAYDAAGNLTTVASVDGAVSTYGYGGSHLMTSLTTPVGGTTTNTYDSSNRVVSQTDPLNRVTGFAYSGAATTITAPDGSTTTEAYVDGRLASQTRGSGSSDAATTAYQYDDASNVTSVTDPLGNVSTFTYDSAGNRLSSTDPLGRVSTWTYNQWRKPLTSTDPLGNVTTMTYDATGNLLTSTSPSGRVQSWAYNSNGTVATSTDPAGKVTSFTYDPAGRLASTTDPDGLVTSLTYNAAGHGTSVTSPDGATATTVSDPAGRIVSVTDPLGRVTTFDYDDAGNRTSTTDALGNVSEAAFDAAGQQISTTDAAGNVTTYGYSAGGLLTTVTDAQNHTTTLTYNSRGDLLSTTDAAGRTTSQSYDLAGRVLSSTRPSGATSTVVYDAAGQVTSSTDPGGFTTSFTYDAAGRLLTTTDPLARATTTAYGLDGEVMSVTLPDLSTQLYGYDSAGRPTSFTNADGLVTTYSYGNAGQLLGKTEPGGLTTSFSYSGGRLQSSTLPDGTLTSFSYDLVGNVVTADRSATVAVDASFVYDSLNRVTSLTDPTGTSSFTYDSRGNLLTEVDGSGDSIAYAYDSTGLLETITYPGSKEVEYSYDAVGQLTSLTDWLDNESTFVWTADGQLDTEAFGNGVVQSRDYDARGQLTQTEVTNLSTSLATFAYAFDGGGQLTSTETTLNGQDVDRSFEYDALSQLSSVATTEGATTTTGGYDATSAGLLTEIVGGRELTYNAAQQLVSIDAIVGADIEFAYDAAGRRTSSSSTTYAFDAAGYLASVTTPAATVGYTTDARGLRQSRTEGATTDDWLWSTIGGLPLLLDDGTRSYIYGPALTPIAQIDDTGAVEYLHTDLLGSVRLITDEDGDPVSTATYDEFGTRTNHTGTADSPFGFTGAWTDAATGLVHLRARDYDPATGQFLTVDALVDQTRQPYAYVGNNPVTRTDPTGHCAGLDGSVHDSSCTYEDFFWYGLPGAIGENLLASWAGAADGVGFNIPMLLDCTSYNKYKNNPSYWAGNFAGFVAATLTFGTMAGLRVGTSYLARSSTANVAPGTTSVTTKSPPRPAPNFLRPTNPAQAPPLDSQIPPGHTTWVGPKTAQYPTGYWKQYNESGQVVNPATGKPPANVSRDVARSMTHVPLPEEQ